MTLIASLAKASRTFFVVVVATALWSAAAFAGPWEASTLQDGATLVHVPLDSDVPTSRFSLIVDVGAAEDPTGKYGLAHAVALAALRGPATAAPDALATLARTRACTIDVDVRMFSTNFSATCPSAVIVEVATALTAHVTNPFFFGVDLEKLREEITSTPLDAPRLREAQVDQLLFPALNRGRAPGHFENAGIFDGQDIEEFFSAHFRSSAVTYLVATSLPMEPFATMLSQAVALPPDVQPRRTRESDPPNVPSNVRFTGERHSVYTAFVLPKVSAASCRGFALILEVELRKVFDVPEAPDAATDPTVYTACRPARDEQLLVTEVTAGTDTESDIDEKMTNVFRQVRAFPRANKKNIAARRNANVRAQRRDPQLALDPITDAISGDGRAVVDILKELAESPTTTEGKLRKISRNVFDPKRKVVVETTSVMKTKRDRNR